MIRKPSRSHRSRSSLVIGVHCSVSVAVTLSHPSCTSASAGPNESAESRSRAGYGTREMTSKRTDLKVGAAYLLGAVYLLAGLWLDPHGHTLRDNLQDQLQFEWQLTHAARVLTRGDNPFFT